MIENEVRRAFERHEHLVPDARSLGITTRTNPDRSSGDGVPQPRRKPKPRSGRWAGLSVICGATLVGLSLVVVGGLTIVGKVADTEVHQETLLPPNPQGQNISGPINILLIGLDGRAPRT